METLQSELTENLPIIEEDDEFYEGIEAPKFVDFSAPDRSRPDDRSWFCLRIGCDQLHEEIDPDALHKSFVLRVMATRSPNLRLRKALSQQNPRSTKECPRSAPVKSAKDGVSRFSRITSIPEKMAITKTKNHPISSLTSTPNQKKTITKPLPSDRKALTTPITKKCPINPEPFRSVKYQKAPAAVQNNQSVVRKLFLHTPKRTDEKRTLKQSSTPMSEVCDGMKKLKIGSLKKSDCSHSAVSLKRTDEKRTLKPSWTPVSEVCDGIKKLKIGSLKRSDSSHTAVSLKKGREISTSLKKEKELNKVVCNNVSEAETDSKSSDPSILTFNSSLVSTVEESLQPVLAASTSSSNSAPETRSEEVVCSNVSEAEADSKSIGHSILTINSKEHSPSSVLSTVEESLQPVMADSTSFNNSTTENRSEKGVEDNLVGHLTSRGNTKCGTAFDGNKENVSVACETRHVSSDTANSESERLKSENCENLTPKEIKAPSKDAKAMQENHAQGGKIRRTTNPKPFRLRTDERGILKEANLEKKQMLEAKKETKLQQNGNTSYELDQRICFDKGVGKGQYKRHRRTHARLTGSLETKMGTSKSQYQKSKEIKDEGIEGSLNKIVKTTSTRKLLKSQCVRAAKKMPVSQFQNVKRALGTMAGSRKVATTEVEANNICLKGKRPTTIPKEPIFHKVHVPKGCTKRPHIIAI